MDKWLTQLLFAAPSDSKTHRDLATHKIALLVGDRAVVAELKARAQKSARPMKLLDRNDAPADSSKAVPLIEAVARGKADVILVAAGDSPNPDLLDLVDRLQAAAIPVYLISTRATNDGRWTQFLGFNVICLGDAAPVRSSFALKRLFDVVMATVLLILLLPMLLVIAVVVKASSPGPIFFKQHRYGLRGEAITVWKFRTMTVMEYGHVAQATRHDARVTPFGRFLRRTSLDELPQIFNVLGGSMSFVGPRPHAVAHNEEYRRLIRGYMYRHSVKPGITGLAQVNGFRGETSSLDQMERRMRYDLAYIRNWSLLLDLKILLRTFATLLSSRSAY
jgi:putative colanic acid biosynthesis UDP-glucose lipid carrier transferase